MKEIIDILDTAMVSTAVGALIAIGGVIATLVVTSKQERARHTASREDRIREERIAAYRKVLSAASVPPANEEDVTGLVLACSEAELLSGSSELIGKARHLWMASLVVLARKGGTNPAITQRDVDDAYEDWRQTRQDFLKLSRTDLGLDPAIIPEIPRNTYD